MKMTSTQMPGHVLVIALNGSLDSAGTAEIESEFAELAESDRYILVDLQAVTLLTSMAVRMLVLAAKTRQRRGGRVALLSPQPMVARGLQTLDMEKIIPIYKNLDDALAQLS